MPACCDLRRNSLAEARALALALPALPDRTKYWDNLRALEAIEGASINRSEPIVDLGCRSGIMLTWLDRRGFRRLYGCDLRLPVPPLRAALRTHHWSTALAGARMVVRHGRRLRRAPIERTGLPGGSFAAATCMSVIEHGVDLDAFFAECARLLRPGGLLALSTDYWPERIDLGGLKRFDAAGTDRIFDRDGVLEYATSRARTGCCWRTHWISRQTSRSSSRTASASPS